MTETITQTLSGYIRELTASDRATQPAAGETWVRMLKRIAVFGVPGGSEGGDRGAAGPQYTSGPGGGATRFSP